MKYNIDKSEQKFYKDVKTIISEARKNVYKSVNHIMVQTNWFIGKQIVEQEQQGEKRAKYGIYLIKNLSKKLTEEFGKGFSERTLREFRQFYTVFSAYSIQHTPSAKSKNENISGEKEIWHTLSAELEKRDFSEIISSSTPWSLLSWSHYRSIMRVFSSEAREYYIKETALNNWDVRTLDRNISTQYYERLLKSPNKQPVVAEMQEKTKNFQANKMEFIKSPSVLEFLNLPANMGYTEEQMEKAIIDNLQNFLLELGKGYAFIGRQKLIRTEAKNYFIDLVFYNYILKCFILIDLKTEKISHKDVGQMDMYVRMFDERETSEGDNPTIGVVLCSETDHDIARYSILKGNEQIFASKYKLYLPTEEELKAEIAREKLNFKLQFGGNNE